MFVRRTIAAVASLALLTVAGPAFAAGPPYTVKVGTNTSGTYSSSFALNGSVTLNAGVPLQCTNLGATGSTTAGSNVNPVFTFDSVTLTGCKVNGTTMPFQQLTTPNFTGTGTNATTANETVAGRIANVTMRASTSLCAFVIKGFANASFIESTQRLAINEVPSSATVGNLKVTSVSGCGGQVQTGSAVTWVATLTTTSTNGAIKLS